jgi:hypothetical protein
MRSRFIAFILFQIIAWSFYFNWEVSSNRKMVTSVKMVQVEDISFRHVDFSSNDEHRYQLILRNDGFYTRINRDRTRENGIWRVNYDIPSLILSSPNGDAHYQIIDNFEDYMQVKLLSTDELARNELNRTESDLLFSSSSLN